MSRRITADLLKRKGACDLSISRFRQCYPRGVIPTEAHALEEADEWDWNWAAVYLLSSRAQKEYSCIREAARLKRIRVRAVEAWAEYNRAEARAFVRLWLADDEDTE